MAESLHIPHNLNEVLTKLSNLVKRLDKVSLSYKKATTSARTFNRSTKTGSRNLDTYTKSTKKAKKGTDQLNSSMGISAGLWARFAGIAAVRVLWDVGRQAVDTAADLDAMGKAMEFAVSGKYKGQFQSGLAKEASESLGLAFLPATEGLTKLHAAMRGTTMKKGTAEDLFMGISKAITTLGLSSEKSHGTYMAFEQIISKGKVSAEELRRQLGDRIPGAFQIAARAMNMTTSELDKMISKGDLMSEVFIPRMAAQLNLEFSEGWKKASMSGRAAMNRLGNSIIDLQKKIGDKLIPTIDIMNKGLKTASTIMDGFGFVAKKVISPFKKLNIELGNIVTNLVKMSSNPMIKAFAGIVAGVKGITYLGDYSSARETVAKENKQKDRIDQYKRIYGGLNKQTSTDFQKSVFAEMVSEEVAREGVLQQELRASNLMSEPVKGGKIQASIDRIKELKRLTEQIGGSTLVDKIFGGGSEDSESSIADVSGGGNRILNVTIGNIIEKNEANFVSGDEAQQEGEAKNMTDAITRSLVSTLQDLGQLVP